MKILIASNFSPLLAKSLLSHEDELVFTSDKQRKLDYQFVKDNGFELVILFSYRWMLPREVVENVHCINLHGSLLPYGRGPYPVLAGWLNREPHGCTICELDAGMDTGPVIVQRQCPMKMAEHSLHSSFYHIVQNLSFLFAECWPIIRNRQYSPAPQRGLGSGHSLGQIKLIQDLLDEYEYSPLSQLLEQIQKRYPGFRLNT